MSFEACLPQKIDFFQNQAKNAKNRDGTTLESVWWLPKKIFSIIRPKLRTEFYFSLPRLITKEFPERLA